MTSKSTLDFIDFVKAEYPTIKEVYGVETVEEAVRDSDIVSIATSAQVGDPMNYPYVNEAWIKKGAIITCPASARFDDDFLLNRARNVADCYNLYVSYEEEAPFPAYHSIPMPAVRCMDMMEEGIMERDALLDLSDIILGKVPVRENPDDIVVFSVGGMPVEDVAWGTMVYRNALEKGIGTKLNLWDEPNLA